MSQTESVWAMDIETWVSLAVLVGGLTGLYAALRREVKHDIAGVKEDIAGVKSDVARLDDRVYALAAGLKPQIEQAQHTET